MSMKRLAIMSAVGSHNNFNNNSISYYTTEKGGQQGLQTMRPGANLHGNVNIMLGGAMLSVVITIVCFVCYCCHRNIKKRSTSTYRQRWMENDPNMEIYSVEQCYDTSGLFIEPAESMTLPPSGHGPPPSYEQVVALDEIVARHQQHQNQQQQQPQQQQQHYNRNINQNHSGDCCPFTNNNGIKCNGCNEKLDTDFSDYKEDTSENELLQKYRIDDRGQGSNSNINNNNNNININNNNNNINNNNNNNNSNNNNNNSNNNNCVFTHNDICDFRLDTKYSDNICRFCGNIIININNINNNNNNINVNSTITNTQIENNKCRCTNISSLNNNNKMIMMTNFLSENNNIIVNTTIDDDIEIDIDEEKEVNCYNNNIPMLLLSSPPLPEPKSSTSPSTTSSSSRERTMNTYQQNNILDFDTDIIQYYSNQSDVNDNNNVPSTSTPTLNQDITNINNNTNNNNNDIDNTNNNNINNNNNNNNNNNELNLKNDSDVENAFNNKTNIIDFENIDENGLIRLDMSQIIDNTGLPTYEAALQLESSGYV